MRALNRKALESVQDDQLRHEWANAWGVNRQFYDDQDRELIATEYKRRKLALPPFAVYQDEETGLWIVAALSPTARTGYIVQSERASEREAWEDAKFWTPSETPSNQP